MEKQPTQREHATPQETKPFHFIPFFQTLYGEILQEKLKTRSKENSYPDRGAGGGRVAGAGAGWFGEWPLSGLEA